MPDEIKKKVGTGKHVQCNACTGNGWWYGSPMSQAHFGGYDGFPEPTECPYCRGTGRREVVRYE